MRIELYGYWYEGPELGEFGEREMQLPMKRKDADELIAKLFQHLHHERSTRAAAEAWIQMARDHDPVLADYIDKARGGE